MPRRSYQTLRAAEMKSGLPYQLFADLVLVLHFLVVIFVVGGLVIVLVGNLRQWAWVNSFGYRMTHLIAIGVVVVQAWLGRLCPLTVLEVWLREHAGEVTYSESFIEHWVQRLLYYEGPFWIFTLAYTVFGLLVIAAWLFFPPQRKSFLHLKGDA